MSRIENMSRRDFLKAGALLGGGLVLGISFTGRAGASKVRPAVFAPNAFIRIGTDEMVTIIVNKSEMGQGVYTSLPMLVAEELEIDLSKVHVEPAPVDPAYNHTEWGPIQGTGGSSSIRSTWEQFRKAGAGARMMLLSAAALTWKVDAAACSAANGFVRLRGTGKKLSYGQLVTKAAKLGVPKEIVLKQPKDFQVIGKPTKRLDTASKVNGKAVFGMDVSLPGMSVAVVARPPVFGAALAGFDGTAAKKTAGVLDLVQVPSGIAVVAKDFPSALKGREVLKIRWNEGKQAGFSTETLRKEYASLSATAGIEVKNTGAAASALKTAAKKLEAEYEVPYLAHATMEPLNCVVDLRPDGCDIWTGTQMQTVDRNNAATIAGLPKEKVQIHTALLGGGFGRRANPMSDFVSEAVHVAKAAKRPVKVIWTREDDLQGGFYRPFWYDRIAAGIDDKGALSAWQHTIVGQSIVAGTPFEAGLAKNGIDQTSIEGAADLPYAIPNLHVELHTTKNSVPVLWWRSVGHSHTAFVVESFLDEMAHLAGKDPLAMRMDLLGDHPRHRAVLELAAKKAGWGRKMSKGRGLGLAVHHSFGSYVAQVAEVSVASSGAVQVHKVWCAIDCGRVVNPSTVEAQMESGIVFGLSAALYGAITFRDGRVEQSNFHDYRMLRMNEMPEVEVSIVRSEEGPQGVGEPGVPPIAPAVCNAIFNVTGKRIRRLPIDPGLLKA